MRFIFREFPLDELAVAASMLARCAGKDDSARRLALIDVLFASQDKWAAAHNPVPILQQIAKQAGFTEKTFDECLKDQTLYNNIMAMRERGGKEYKVESDADAVRERQDAEGRRDDRGTRQADPAAAPEELSALHRIPHGTKPKRPEFPCCGRGLPDSFSGAI